MGIYAMINPDGVVVNTLVKDPETEIPIEDGWLLVEITGMPVGIGCTYDGSEFHCD